MGVQIQQEKTSGIFAKIFGDIDFNRYVIMAHTLVIQSCAGSVAVYFIMQLHSGLGTALLSIMAAITMGANSVAIAQGPMKLVIQMCVTTVVAAMLSILYVVFIA